MKKIKMLAVLAIVTALTACGGGGGGGGGGSEPSLKQSDITGLWDLGETINGVKDDYYAYIDDNGVLLPFDYLGDGYDQGPNCYDTDAGSAKELFVIDDTGAAKWFTVVSNNPVQYAEINITVEVLNGGNSLHMITPDYWDYDEDGNIAENNEDTYPRVLNLVTDNLQPVCTSEQLSAFYGTAPS